MTTQATLYAGPSEHADGGYEQGFFAYHGFWAPGVRAFRSLRFKAKVVLILLTMLLPMLALLAWLVASDTEAAMQARRDATRQHVEVAHGILAWAQAQEAAGTLPREQAQAMAIKAVAALRYDDKEYFWINDLQPRMVMHPFKPELNGKDVGDLADPNGLHLFRAFADKVRTDGKGFVSYQWPRPGDDQPVDKLSYVQGFAPWGWVIGSGVYVDDLREPLVHRLVAIGVALATVLALLGYLFYSFYLVMNGGLQETQRHLRAMTMGDLTTTPHPWGSDEPAQLMLELRAMQDALRGMVARVRGASDDIVHSSSEIATGAQDLARRTEQTAANLEETAASMEQIASTVGHAEENTIEVSRVARSNAQAAAHGGQVMHEVVATMESIQQSSERIRDIIGTINGIAFQTNILALNAAVEAARAGEQGRGFAVVASEVRTLAQRSAAAAKEIGELIGASVEQVRAGTETVHKAGATIGQIVDSSQRVNQLLTEIATGAQEQNAGIGQVGQAVQELDQATQQNAALVEQTASAASAMKEQALALVEEVSRFRLPAGTRLGVSTAVVRVEDFDFDKAIDAHRQWKVKLRKAIADREKLDAAAICRDDQCPLGKWIHGPGGERWGSKPMFAELLDKHAQFHQAAGKVAHEINAGRYSEAAQMIGSESLFSQRSNEVVGIIASVKRAVAA